MVKVGQKYGALKVSSEVDRREGPRRWACVCDCGRRRVVFETDLLEGRVDGCVACEKWRETQGWVSGAPPPVGTRD